MAVPLFNKLIRGHVRTVPGNMQDKFTVALTIFKAIDI